MAIIDSMSNFGKCFTKHAITFDLTKIERNKLYFVGIKIVVHSMLPSKISKSQEKKSTFFKNSFSVKL